MLDYFVSNHGSLEAATWWKVIRYSLYVFLAGQWVFASENQLLVDQLLDWVSGHASSELTCGPIQLHLTQQKVKIDDQELELTAYEYKVLEYLMLNRDKVISKTELTEHIYDQDFDCGSGPERRNLPRCAFGAHPCPCL